MVLIPEAFDQVTGTADVLLDLRRGKGHGSSDLLAANRFPSSYGRSEFVSATSQVQRLPQRP
jgi:hypothetical protein